MNILHTSDWHLGKQLEGFSRLNEQEEFLLELENIANERNVDLIVVAGDIYDNTNPSAEAEKLFYKYIVRLSLGGKRPVLLIAGNHDSPERLAAPNPLALSMGIILVGMPKTIIAAGDYGYYCIVDSGEGFIELCINNEHVVVLTMPYISERRLNEIICDSIDESHMQRSYSDKIAEIFKSLENKFRDDTINIVAAHLFVAGGIESGSEREIQLGGSFAVDPSVFPKNAQYIALGHLHRPQKAALLDNGYYSGSPIQYSRSEASYVKSVNLITASYKTPAFVEKIYLRNYKPIEIWTLNSVSAAINKCSENADKSCWVYLDIFTDVVLLSNEIKQIKSTKADIIEIRPIFNNIQNDVDIDFQEEKSVREQFIDFYLEKNGVEPVEDLVNLFMEIAVNSF